MRDVASQMLRRHVGNETIVDNAESRIKAKHKKVDNEVDAYTVSLVPK